MLCIESGGRAWYARLSPGTGRTLSINGSPYQGTVSAPLTRNCHKTLCKIMSSNVSSHFLHFLHIFVKQRGHFFFRKLVEPIEEVCN